jgi:hypothetical protein
MYYTPIYLCDTCKEYFSLNHDTNKENKLDKVDSSMVAGFLFKCSDCKLVAKTIELMSEKDTFDWRSMYPSILQGYNKTRRK